MDEGIDANGIKVGSSLWELLAGQQDYASMSNLEKLEWANNLVDTAAQALLWIKSGNQLENLEMEGKTISFTNADGKVIKGTVGKDGSVTAEDGAVYKDVYRNYDGTYLTDETTQEAPVKEEPE
jgi:hypothetical protein